MNVDYPVPGSSFTSSINAQTITIPEGLDQVYAYYGCYLNVYDMSVTVNKIPIPLLLPAGHHCLVAQIAYDEAPISPPTSAWTCENCDKLAQRNINITPSDNPGPESAHRIPQTFDTVPTPAYTDVTGQLLNYQAELMIDWGNTPVGSVATIYWPQVDSSTVLSLAKQLYSTQQLTAADAHTIQVTVNAGLTFVPIPPGGDQFFAGVLTVDLPLGVVQGEEFNIVVRRILYGYPFQTPRDSESSSSSVRWRYVTGTFPITIPVSNSLKLLWREEQALAILKWRLENWSPTSRWYPVLLRYISVVAGRVNGFGGNAGSVTASPPGVFPIGPSGPVIVPPPASQTEYTGKVIGMIYDQFGDFEGFELLVEGGSKMKFRGREDRIESLIRFAWEKRVVITVVENGSSDWPSSIILRQVW